MADKTFKEWLMQHLDDRSPTGDLAREVLGNPYFPDSPSFLKGYRYLKLIDAWWRAIDTYVEAYKQYKEEGNGI